MSEQNTVFHVGDQVVHWVYGLGEVIYLDEKELAGVTKDYYVVIIRDMTLWVPMNETGEHCLRFLTPAQDFDKLFGILSGPAEPLSTQRFERRKQLTDRLKEGTLESICRVIRDLALYKQIKRLNVHDNSIQKRARRFLLEEWSIVLSVTSEQADRELKKLIKAGLRASQS
jgi:CarD family transcriptional regulator